MMARHLKRTLVALSMSLVLVASFVTPGAAQALPPDQGAEPTIEALRGALLAAVAAEAEKVPLSGEPGLDFVKIEGPEEIDAFLRDIGKNLPEVVRTRVFEAGQLIFEGEPLSLTIYRQEAIYHPATGSLFVVGGLGNRVTIEDVRTLEDSGRVFFLRDVYLDGEVADLSVGRSLPVFLESTSAVASSAPQVFSLGGVTSASAGVANGRVAMGKCGGTWDGGMALNDQAGVYPWTVNGSNFGSAKGKVTLGGQAVPMSPSARLPWTASQIVIDPTLSPYSGPATTLLKITTANGASTSYGVSFVPAVRSRVYGQCTWFVALTRLAMGLQPSPTAYGGYSDITGRWVPRPGDQLAWMTKHTAIITGVTGPIPEPGGLKTYKLTIGQYNADCRNSPGSYSTDSQVRTVNGQTSVTKFPKSSVAALGAATVFFR